MTEPIYDFEFRPGDRVFMVELDPVRDVDARVFGTVIGERLLRGDRYYRVAAPPNNLLGPPDEMQDGVAVWLRDPDELEPARRILETVERTECNPTKLPTT